MFARNCLVLLISLFLGACAAYSGSGLKPGEARVEDVIRVMGEPAMRWQDPGGAVQLAYPRGPAGVHTYMVHLAPDGRLERIENVMDMQAFAQVRKDMTRDQVLRTLGPPVPAWTDYFKARDELAWEWRWCNEVGAASRFNVLFDATAGTVRSTQSRMEICGKGYCTCGR